MIIIKTAFETDIAIIGGGASGLAAAVAAGREGGGLKIAVFDAQPRCGKKLLSTGNGRCNLTNREAEPSCYHTDDAQGLRRVFSGVNVGDTLAFFENMGLICREEEEGRIYPSCGQASAVLDLLRLELAKLGISEVCGCRVETIRRENDRFVMRSPLGAITAECVIIACGGKAAPNLGGVDWGYQLLCSVGHSTTRLNPSLCPVPVDSPHLSSLKGIRAHAKASILEGDKVLHSDIGEVQFAEKWLSGIVIFQLSSAAAGVNGDLAVALDMLPERSRDELISLLKSRRTMLPHLTLENYLTGVFNKRVGMCILKQAGLSPLSRSVSGLTDEDIVRIAGIIKHWRFPVSGKPSWNNAQVTSGGIPLGEFDGMTMQSRKCKGLFAAGEVLNVDGFCGGFNLQWAWSSGILAGRSAHSFVVRNRSHN